MPAIIGAAVVFVGFVVVCYVVHRGGQETGITIHAPEEELKAEQGSPMLASMEMKNVEGDDAVSGSVLVL